HLGGRGHGSAVFQYLEYDDGAERHAYVDSRRARCGGQYDDVRDGDGDGQQRRHERADGVDHGAGEWRDRVRQLGYGHGGGVGQRRRGGRPVQVGWGQLGDRGYGGAVFQYLEYDHTVE